MKAYILRLAAWTSQGLHCIILGGHHDMTLSARCYVEYRLRGKPRWRWAHDAVNLIFLTLFGQHEHCMQSFAADEAFAREVLSLRAQPPGRS